MRRRNEYAASGRAGAAQRHERFSTPDWAGEASRARHWFRPEAALTEEHDEHDTWERRLRRVRKGVRRERPARDEWN